MIFFNVNLFNNKTNNAQENANHTPRDSVISKLIIGNIEERTNRNLNLMVFEFREKWILNSDKTAAMPA